VTASRGVLDDPAARRLAAGELEALFLPGYGMLGASLRHRGVELLGRVSDLDAAAAKGSTAGIPFLHPWANRLEGWRYRASGREVQLDPASPLLHADERGLPIHGVPWSRLSWAVTGSTAAAVQARLDWTTGELLAVFPFPHRMELAATLGPGGLTLETRLAPLAETPVPVSFGFHPYLALPGLPRSAWRLALPPMRRLVLDARGIPTGSEAPFAGGDAPLGRRSWDDGFALPDAQGAAFSLRGAGRRLTVELLGGFGYAQVFAPPDRDFVALEPMTAPTGALGRGVGYGTVDPGGTFRAAFRIRVEEDG